MPLLILEKEKKDSEMAKAILVLLFVAIAAKSGSF